MNEVITKNCHELQRTAYFATYFLLCTVNELQGGGGGIPGGGMGGMPGGKGGGNPGALVCQAQLITMGR